MLIHPWDAATDDQEWRDWLARGHDFGQLVAGPDASGWPAVVPAHFLFDGEATVVLHLARPNPIWAALEADPRVVLTVVDDYAYIPTAWRAPADQPGSSGVPTSYYAAVQLRCTADIVDDPPGKAEILRRQLARLQPAGGHAAVEVGQAPYGPLLSAIRGLRLSVTEVRAKFKFDDNKPAEQRESVADRLADRDEGRDMGARTEQLRRLAAAALGDTGSG